MTSRWKETFWPPASQLYSPASALPACCTTSRLPRPVASTRTFELELSFFPSLYHVTSVWAWATSQLSVVRAPALACTSLRAGCSLANTTTGSADKEGCTGSETPSKSGMQQYGKEAWAGRKGAGPCSRLCVVPRCPQLIYTFHACCSKWGLWERLLHCADSSRKGTVGSGCTCPSTFLDDAVFLTRLYREHFHPQCMSVPEAPSSQCRQPVASQ